MPLVLALDQGTTATTALAVNEAREIVARSSVPTPLHRPKPGWAENDPLQVRDAVRDVLSRVVADVDAGAIEAIGITNQRETTVAWDPSTGAPLAPAVSWQCRRTAELCRRLRDSEGIAAMVRDRTGLVIDPYFSATKVRWLLDNIKAVGDAEARGELLFGTMDSFLCHALTGEHVTDPSNASRTMVYNIRQGDWDHELADTMGVPLETLADVRPSSGSFGAVDAGATLGSELEALQGVPVLGVAGDQQASLFGHGCFEPGQTKGTLGTGAFFLVNTGSEPLPPDQGILTTVAWDLGDGLVYALEGAAFACGSALEWAASVGLLDGPEALDTYATKVDDAGGVAFVPALYGLGAPHWDPDAKATFTGLSAATTREHIARAIAEGLAAQNALLVRALASCGQSVAELSLDGGVSRSELLCQLLADATGVRVRRSNEGEVTALGAAGLAGLAADAWSMGDLAPSATEAFDAAGQARFMDGYEEAVEGILGKGRSPTGGATGP